jgi:hypothetical protein
MAGGRSSGTHSAHISPVLTSSVQYAYVNPSNLSNAWPWLAGVTTVSQFDVAVLNYFTDANQWQQTKFVNQLGCSNATGTVIQYQRSRLCSNWVNSIWGRECTARYSEFTSHLGYFMNVRLTMQMVLQRPRPKRCSVNQPASNTQHRLHQS